MYRKRNQLMEICICLADAVMVLVSLVIAGLLRYRTFHTLMVAEEMDRLISVLLVLHVAAFYSLKAYDGFFRRGRYKELFFSVKYNVIMIAASTLLSFSMKADIFTSRLVMGYFFVCNTLLVWIMHLVIRNWSRVFGWRKGKEKSLLIVSDGKQLESIVKRFQRSKETLWHVVGAVVLGEPQEGTKQFLAGQEIPMLSCEEEAYLDYATTHVVDEVFIHVDAIQKQEDFLKKMILEFEKMGVVVALNLDLFDLGLSGEKRIDNLEQYHVVAFTSRLFDYRMVVLKRLMDIVGALAGLAITLVVGIVLAPFLLLESPGPLIFKQKRVGVNGRIFDFYKFRSMYADAEERKKELMKQNEMHGLMFKMENDPRITKVGAFIRKTSIDELPQFWNVLKGDMSLVGTRPPTVDEYEQYNYSQKRRISFRPGITGLWQISGRSDITDFDDVVKLDLEYIDNWSLFLDVKIIFKTIGVVFRGSGAR